MAADKTDSKGNKITFIRKGGKVIPIKAKGGGSGSGSGIKKPKKSKGAKKKKLTGQAKSEHHAKRMAFHEGHADRLKGKSKFKALHQFHSKKSAKHGSKVNWNHDFETHKEYSQGLKGRKKMANTG